MAGTPNGQDGFPYNWQNFTAPKWCRHRDQFVVYEFTKDFPNDELVTRATCSNCSADTGDLLTGMKGAKSTFVTDDAARRLAYDALMKIEKVGAVSEVEAP